MILKLIRIEAVMDKTSLAMSTIYKKMKEGTFPRNVNLGRTACWLESEIDEYILSLIDQRDKKGN
jgi:prophage regulatory protein